MAFNKKEDRDNIEKFNSLAGMSHRSKPYDLNKPQDIIEATIMATAEYVDMSNYWSALEQLVENFDESIEYYEPAAWLKIGLKGSTEDEELEDARSDLYSASDSFRILMDRAEEKCLTMWKVVLNSADHSVKEYFFGEDLSIEEDILEEVFEEYIFDVLDGMDYDGTIEQSADSFAKQLKAMLLYTKNNI